MSAVITTQLILNIVMMGESIGHALTDLVGLMVLNQTVMIIVPGIVITIICISGTTPVLKRGLVRVRVHPVNMWGIMVLAKLLVWFMFSLDVQSVIQLEWVLDNRAVVVIINQPSPLTLTHSWVKLRVNVHQIA